MNLRLKCSCGTTFTTSDELRGRMVRCPQCRKTLRVPETVPAAATANTEQVSFVTEEPDEDTNEQAPDSKWQSRDTNRSEPTEQPSSAWNWLLLILVLVLVPTGVVGTILLLPYLKPKEPQTIPPRDPREQLAERYLAAVARQDFAEASRLSVGTTHPRLTGVERVGLSERQSPMIHGKFQGLRQFHEGISQKYTYNPERGRFEPKDELGLGLGVLSQLEEAKKKAQDQAAANAADPARKNMKPEERDLEDALSTFGAIGELASKAGGLLTSGTLGPTYEDLLKKTEVSLSDPERSLAEHFARDPAKWQRLLGRPFLDLPDLGEFELHEAELVGTIRTEGQSLGEPGRPIKLRLVRFTMGSIDTGWRVWQAE